MIKYILVSSLFIRLFSCDSIGSGDDSQKPVIDNLKALRSSILVNDTTTITASARDLNGEDLDYVWTAPDGGTFEGNLNKNTVIWKAPSTQGNYRIILKVNNESGKSTSKTISITITPISTPVIEITSPTFGQYIPSSLGIDTIRAKVTNLQASSVDSLKCFINNTPIGKFILTNNQNFLWNISGLNGSQEIMVQAWTHSLIPNTTTTGTATVTVSIEGTIGKPKPN